MIALIIAADALLGVALAAITGVVIARDGRHDDQPVHQGAGEEYAVELHDMAAYAAEAPPEFAPPERRRPVVDALFAEETAGLPYLPPAPRGGRHYEDTVEIVPADYRPAIGARRIALVTDTQPMTAVQA
jgi:hypothetical protein